MIATAVRIAAGRIAAAAVLALGLCVPVAAAQTPVIGQKMQDQTHRQTACDRDQQGGG